MYEVLQSLDLAEPKAAWLAAAMSQVSLQVLCRQLIPLVSELLPSVPSQGKSQLDKYFLQVFYELSSIYASNR